MNACELLDQSIWCRKAAEPLTNVTEATVGAFNAPLLYKIDIQQGNVINQEMLNKLEYPLTTDLNIKCVKNVLREKENDLWCDWLEQSCVGPSCAYASCVRNQLLPENRCGLAVKRITKDIVQPTDFKINVKLKGRAAGSIDMDDLV